MTDAKPVGQWEFTDVQNLVRHRKSGKFYGRFRVAGKRKFYALDTDKKTIAKLRLLKKAAEIEQHRHAQLSTGTAVKMGDMFATYRGRYASDSSLSEGTKKAKGDHDLRIEKTWPGILDKAPEDIAPEAIVEWANRLHSTERFVIAGTKKPRKYSAESVNKSVDALRAILKIAVERGAILVSPFDREPELRKNTKKSSPKRLLKLPTRSEMDLVFAKVKAPSLPSSTPAGLAEQLRKDALDVAELIEGLAYSGMRLREAGRTKLRDFGEHEFVVHGTKSAGSLRRVPINPRLRALIDQVKARRNPKSDEPLFRVKEAEKTLTKVCAEVGVQRLRHHDLRHYFATVCLESGVDAKTLSEWMGHGDGGTLVLRTYGHLRNEHSLRMASKVTF